MTRNNFRAPKLEALLRFLLLRYPMIFPRVLLCITMLDGYFFLFEGFIEISLWFNIPMNFWVKFPSGIKWDETGHQECLRGEWVHGAPAGMWFSREYGTGAHFLLLGIPWHPKWHPKWLERISQKGSARKDQPERISQMQTTHTSSAVQFFVVCF